VQSGWVYFLAEEPEVLGQLAHHARVVGGSGAPDLVVLGHLSLPVVRGEPALPEILGLPEGLADPAREHEEQIAERVDVLERPLADVLDARELEHAPLGAPAHRAGLVEEATHTPASREHERLEG